MEIQFGQIIEFYPYRKAIVGSKLHIKVTDEIYKYIQKKIERCSEECIKQYREFYRKTYESNLTTEQFDQKWPNVKPRMDNHICFVVEDYGGKRFCMMYSDNILTIGTELTIRSW